MKICQNFSTQFRCVSHFLLDFMLSSQNKHKKSKKKARYLEKLFKKHLISNFPHPQTLSSDFKFINFYAFWFMFFLNSVGSVNIFLLITSFSIADELSFSWESERSKLSSETFFFLSSFVEIFLCSEKIRKEKLDFKYFQLEAFFSHFYLFSVKMLFESNKTRCQVVLDKVEGQFWNDFHIFGLFWNIFQLKNDLIVLN